MVRWVVLISNRVTPDPETREIPGLVADFSTRGLTYLPTRSAIAPGPYDGQLAVINKNNQLIAAASFNAVFKTIPFELRPGVYKVFPLTRTKRWFLLSRFDRISPPADLRVLGWKKKNGQLLRMGNLPSGHRGLLFRWNE